MFELCDKMVGIYKTHDVTQTICIQPQLVQDRVTEILKAMQAEQPAEQEAQKEAVEDVEMTEK